MQTQSRFHHIFMRCLAVLTLAAVCSACSDLTDATDVAAPDIMTLTADTTSFVSGTRASDISYRLYMVDDVDNTPWNLPANNLLGTLDPTAAAATDAAGYLGTSASTGGVIVGDDVPGKFNKRSWNFYGITLSTATDPASAAAVSIVDGVPVYTFSRPASDVADATPRTLPDVRYAHPAQKLCLERTQNGAVPMQFRHSLCRLVVRISHASKHSDGSDWGDETLRRFYVYDHTAGSLNMATGLWSHESADVDTLAVNATEVTFGSTATSVTEEFLIFPTSQLSIRALMKPINSDDHNTLTDPIIVDRDGNGEPMAFEANHVYTLQLNYMEDGTFVITAYPNYYDFVDLDTKELNVGTPTLFNGVVWSDRNVGATSATYETLREWEEMRGYYYQVGRNIPYSTCPTANYCINTNGYLWVQTDGDCTQPNSRSGTYLYPHIPGVWRQAEALCNHTSFMCTTDEDFAQGGLSSLTFYREDKSPTTNPAEYVFVKKANASTSYYRDVYLYVDLPTDVPDSTKFTTKQSLASYYFVSNPQSAANYRWSYNVTGMWADPTLLKQPCPPGWRIPTTAEWKGIMPVSELTGDITFNTGVSHKQRTDSTWFEASANDPEAGSRSIYFCRKEGGKSRFAQIYIIKQAGTSQAYGLRISVDTTLNQQKCNSLPDKNSASVRARSVLNIDRYTLSNPAEADFTLTSAPEYDGDGNLYTQMPGKERVDWYRVETLSLPVCGVAQYRYLALIWSGTEAQYATSDGAVVRIKVGGSISSRYVYVDTSTKRFAALSIRPVRDASVQW